MKRKRSGSAAAANTSPGSRDKPAAIAAAREAEQPYLLLKYFPVSTGEVTAALCAQKASHATALEVMNLIRTNKQREEIHGDACT